MLQKKSVYLGTEGEPVPHIASPSHYVGVGRWMKPK
jgi:hypothetical protein